MSRFSDFINRIRRFIRREAPEIEIPIEKPEIPITPPIFKEEEKPIIKEPEKPEIEIPEEIKEKEIPEEKLSKVVTFEERIRGTRIKRTVERSYPIETNDGEIHKTLDSQYDNGGNYVINVKSIEVRPNIEYEENEIDRGMPGSADVS